MKKKILILIASILILSKLTHALDGEDWREKDDTFIARIREEEATKRLTATQIQKEEKKLKDALYELESRIFYTKHLSPIKTVHERTAFMIMVAGACGSLVTPFKLIKSSPHHPFKTFTKRLAVMATTLCFTTTAAYTISFMRPFLWYQEHRAEKLKKKIFDLQNVKQK